MFYHCKSSYFEPFLSLLHLQQLSELELARRQMADVPLLFGVISQDYMNPRKSLESSHQMVGVLSHIYAQLCAIGYLNDIGSSLSIPTPSGEGQHVDCGCWLLSVALDCGCSVLLLTVTVECFYWVLPLTVWVFFLLSVAVSVFIECCC